jgi:hypothetical protein
MIFSSIREKIANRVLESKFESNNRERVIINFEEAKNVGLLFSTTNPEDYNHIKAFISFLNENNVQVTPLVYVETKKVPEYYYLNKNLTILTKKEINWLHLPKDYVIHKFIRTPFHMLIDLSTSFNLPLYYIICLSSARFKIGRLVENRDHFDLMLDTREKNSVEHLIEQIKHYTSILKSPY